MRVARRVREAARRNGSIERRDRASDRLHRPEPFARIDDAPDPFDAPSPDLAWLAHPAITGLAPETWAELIDRLLVLHHGQRETRLDQRRGQRPRIKGDGTTGRRPILTLPDRLLAVVLYHRLALPQIATAELFGVAAETVNRRMRDLRQLLNEDGTAIPPARTRLRTLEDLYRYTDRKGIARHQKIKPAC